MGIAKQSQLYASRGLDEIDARQNDAMKTGGTRYFQRQDARFGSLADIAAVLLKVSCTPESGHHLKAVAMSAQCQEQTSSGDVMRVTAPPIIANLYPR